MKYQDLVVQQKYIVNGEEKVKWLNVGTKRTNDNGKEFIELNLFPETTIWVFDQKDRTEKPAVAQEEVINVDDTEDLPF